MKLEFTNKTLTTREAVNYVMKGICSHAAVSSVLEAEGLAMSGQRAACLLSGTSTCFKPTLKSVDQSFVITVLDDGDLNVPSAGESVRACILAHTLSQISGKPVTLSVSSILADQLAVIECPTDDSFESLFEFLNGLTKTEESDPMDTAVKLLKSQNIEMNFNETDLAAANTAIPLMGEIGNSDFTRSCLRFFAESLVQEPNSMYFLSTHPERSSIHSILTVEGNQHTPKNPGKLCALITSDPTQIRSSKALNWLTEEGLLLLRVAHSDKGQSLFSQAEMDALKKKKISVFASESTDYESTKNFVKGVMNLVHGDGKSDEAKAVKCLDLNSESGYQISAQPLMPTGSNQNADETSQWRFHLLGKNGVDTHRVSAFNSEIQSLAVESLYRDEYELTHYPLVLRDGHSPKPLYAFFDEILDDMGTNAEVLSAHKDYFIYKTAESLLDSIEPVSLLSALKSGLKGFLSELEISEAGRAAFNDELDAFFSKVPEAECLGLGSHVFLKLYLTGLKRAKGEAVNAFMSEARKLAQQLQDILSVQLAKEHEKTGNSGQSLGPIMGSMFKDGMKSPRLHSGFGTIDLDTERKNRIEQSLKVIKAFIQQAEKGPRVILIHKDPLPSQIPITGVKTLRHEQPLGIAQGVFRGLANEMAELFLAIRVAKLEAADAFDKEIHGKLMKQFSLSSCTESEWAVFPVVAVMDSSENIQAFGLNEFSSILSSNLPIHVLLHENPGTNLINEKEDTVSINRDLGYLAVSHKDAFVCRSSLSTPIHLSDVLEKMVQRSGPGVSLVATPDPSEAAYSWATLHAFIAGRSTGLYQYDPDAGRTWADRFDFSGSPSVEESWVKSEIVFQKDDGSEDLMKSVFTFADAVSLVPYYRNHFMVLDASEWSDNQIQLSEFLQDDEKFYGQYVPFIWVIDQNSAIHRAILTRELASTSKDRLDLWLTLRELGGFDNSHALILADKIREESEHSLQSQLVSMKNEYQTELETVRTETAREALSQLARVLVEMDPGQQLGFTEAVSAPAVPSAPQEIKDTTAEDVQGEVVEAVEEEEETFEEEAFVDSELCTSCNECVAINQLLFLYNDNKQVYLGDVEAGSYLQLVNAAEKCPSRCIHPGSPRANDSTVTDELIAKAAKFN